MDRTPVPVTAAARIVLFKTVRFASSPAKPHKLAFLLVF